jgi:hypothetical protein
LTSLDPGIRHNINMGVAFSPLDCASIIRGAP